MAPPQRAPLRHGCGYESLHRPQEPMSTISVRPLTCLLERGAGLPALQVAVEINEHADGARLLLNAAALASWPASVVRGVARLPVSEQVRPDGVAVRVVALDGGGLSAPRAGVRARGRALPVQSGAGARRRAARGLRGARGAGTGTDDRVEGARVGLATFTRRGRGRG